MNRYKVISIGAGPGGLALAIECIEHGLKPEDILVLEKGDAPIDAIRKFYPEKKMTVANYKNLPTETLGHLNCFGDLTKDQTLRYFDDLIKKYDLRIQYKTEVTRVQRDDSGFSIYHGHDCSKSEYVGIGIGILGRPNKPAFKIPSTLKDRVLYDLTTKKIENENVLVVGGGDTSSEYCQALCEDGNTVTLCYRGKDFARMLKQNVEAVERLAHLGKLRLLLGVNIREIADTNGLPNISFVEESAGSTIFDRVVYAIGGTTPTNFLKSSGIEFVNDWPKVDDHAETNILGLFLLGDLVAGKQGGSIITAYNAAFKSAKEIVRRINGPAN